MTIYGAEIRRRFAGEPVLRRRLRIAANLLAHIPLEERSTVAWAWVNEAGAVCWQTRLPEYTIGRAAECAPRLESRSVSRVHARVKQRADGFFIITDLASKNGLRVNERVVLKTTLFAGDLVEIGGIGLVFFGDPEAEEAGDRGEKPLASSLNGRGGSTASGGDGCANRA